MMAICGRLGTGGQTILRQTCWSAAPERHARRGDRAGPGEL